MHMHMHVHMRAHRHAHAHAHAHTQTHTHTHNTTHTHTHAHTHMHIRARGLTISEQLLGSFCIIPWHFPDGFLTVGWLFFAFSYYLPTVDTFWIGDGHFRTHSGMQRRTDMVGVEKTFELKVFSTRTTFKPSQLGLFKLVWDCVRYNPLIIR